MSTPTIVIRGYQASDEDAVLALLRRTLGEGGSFERTAEFWRWKHLENAFGASQLLLATNQEVVGLRAFMRWGFNSPAGSLRAVRAVDTATHPDYRRQGVFARLTQTSLDQARADGVHLIFNTPNPQSMAGYLKLGWHLIGRPRLLVRPLNPLGITRGLLLRSRAKLHAEDVPGFFRSPPRGMESLFEHGERVEQILTFDDGLTAEGLRTARSLDFLRWRYANAPSLRYFALWTGERPLTGLTIFRPSIRNGLREIMLCEFLIGYGAATHARDLIAQLSKMVRADYLVAAASPGSYHWGTLRRAGFIPLPERFSPNFTCYPLNWPADAPDPRRLQHWRLSLGDLEVF
jgi:GNAT superfamily N-acetyltransferase